MLLVRHTQTDPLARGLCYGWTDFALSREGENAVAAIALQLAHPCPRLVVSSDRIRCLRLAKAIADQAQCPLNIDARWRERCFGTWEGVPWDTIHARDATIIDRLAAPDFSPPGGESLNEMAIRIDAARNELICQNDIIVVAHGGSIAVAACLARNRPLTDTARYIPRHGETTEL